MVTVREDGAGERTGVAHDALEPFPPGQREQFPAPAVSPARRGAVDLSDLEQEERDEGDVDKGGHDGENALGQMRCGDRRLSVRGLRHHECDDR